jgi:hypothetical protein
MTMIRTPLGVLEDRNDYLRVTSYESQDCRTWIHILRCLGTEPGTPEFAIVHRDDEAAHVVQLGEGRGDYATDAEVVRHVLKELGIEGPVHEWAIHEGGRA